MSDFSVSGIIQGDSSDFQEAVSEATGALQSFLDIAGGVAAGEGIANLFGTVVNGAVSAVGAMSNTAEEFQNWGAVIGDLGTQTNDLYSGLSDTIAGAGQKAAASSLEAQDALDKYNEKIAQIQDNIATVMQGQNVIDAQTAMYDKLGQLAQNYQDKVNSINDQIAQAQDDLLQKEADQAQSMNNTLEDMTDSHNTAVFNATAEAQQKMSETKSAVEKAALQKQLDEKVALLNTEFQNAYDTKQKELQRNLDQEKDADQRATDQKVASLQDQLAKATETYNQQVDAEKAAGDKAVANAEASNQKKLAQYQQELADEERSYELSVAKRAASGASGGGGSTSAAGLLRLARNVLEAGDSMVKTKNSAEDLLSYLGKISDTTPFNLEDLEKTGELMTENNVDAAKMLPTIEDLSGHFQKDLGTTANAVLMAMHGRAMELKNQFNISGEAMDKALGRPVKTANDVLEAIQKITQEKFSDGISIESDKSGARLDQLHNQVTKLVLDIMGISEETGKPIKGGMFDSMTQAIQQFDSFLKTHRTEIAAFVKDVVGGIEHFAEAVISNWGTIKPILEGLAAVLAVVFAASVITAIVGIISAIGAFVAAFVAAGAVGGVAAVIGTAIAAIGGPITLIAIAVVGLAYLFIFHFNEVKSFIATAVKFITDNFLMIVAFLVPGGPLIAGIIDTVAHFITNLSKGEDAFHAFKDAIAQTVEDIGHSLQKLIDFAKNALSYLNPFAKHSPSLIEQVRDGVDQIKSMYGEVGNLQINTPSIGGLGTSGGQVYNSYSTIAPAISMTNSFNVGSQANATNVAEYIAYQLMYKGF